MKATVAILLCSILLLAAAFPSDAAARGLGDDFPWGSFGNFPWPSPNDFKFPTSVVCNEKGPCFKKKLVCPPKCTKSWSRSGKNGGAGGGSSSCFLDCKKCVAHC